MRLFGKVNSAIDRFDRAEWMTPPFDLSLAAAAIGTVSERYAIVGTQAANFLIDGTQAANFEIDGTQSDNFIITGV